MIALLPVDEKNYHLIDELYSDTYIAKVGYDERAAGTVRHPFAKYLGAYLNGSLVGAFLIIESGFIELDLHALLTKRALPWCRDFGRMCLDYAFSIPYIQRVTANVLEGLESAANYCLKLGFEIEGFRPCVGHRSGQLIGMHMLGMTREKWGSTA